jgi:hypothetical protein
LEQGFAGAGHGIRGEELSGFFFGHGLGEPVAELLEGERHGSASVGRVLEGDRCGPQVLPDGLGDDVGDIGDGDGLLWYRYM